MIFALLLLYIACLTVISKFKLVTNYLIPVYRNFMLLAAFFIVNEQLLGYKSYIYTCLTLQLGLTFRELHLKLKQLC